MPFSRRHRPTALVAVVLAGSLGFLSGGCELLGLGKSKTAADLPLPAAAPATGAPVPGEERVPLDRVAAVVNSVVITWLELVEKAQPVAMARVAAEPDPAKKTEVLLATYREVLDALIVNELLGQEAAKLALTVTTDEIDRAVDGIMKRNGMDKETFVAELVKAGYTEASHREEVRGHLLRMKVIALKVKSRISTDDDVLKAYYEKLKREFATAPEVHVQMILLGLPPVGDDDYGKVRAKALADAREIETAVKGGASFAELANKHSPGGMTDGDWGWVKPDSFADKKLVLALQTMKPGEVRVVDDEKMVRVVRVVEKKEGGVAPFESVKGEILERYAEEETNRLSAIWYEELKATSYVEVKIPELTGPKTARAPTSGTAVP